MVSILNDVMIVTEYFLSKIERGANMWTAVIITLFVGGLSFYALAQYHHNIENKDFTSISSANSDATREQRRRSIAIAVLDKLVTVVYALWKRLWKRMNRRKRFFKKYNARCAAKRHLLKIALHHQLRRFLTSVQEQTTSAGLYIFERLDNSVLYTYGMFMTVSLPKVPTVWSIRMFTGWWWLYCILVSVAYKASLTAILATPAPRVTIDTLEQLAESNVGCGGWGDQSKEFFVTSLDIASQKVGKKFEIIYDVDSAVERVAAGHFAYYENIYFLHYLKIKHKDINVINRYNDTEDERNIDKTKGKILHIMANCVINMPISVGLQKNSPLKPKIDSYLTKVVEAGLVKKWLNDAMFKIRTTEAEQEKKEIKALMNLNKLYGAIAVLLAGYTISVFILMLEITLWYCVEKRKPDFDKYNLKMYYEHRRKKS